MDVIKEEAKKFCRGVEFIRDLEKFDGELSSKLFYNNRDIEKLRFLAYLKDIVESNYQEHAKVCKDTDHCSANKAYEIALYSIRQQFDNLQQHNNDFTLKEKPAMIFFTEGKQFDAFTTIRECVKKAKISITLIDGYIDENTLIFFEGKEPTIQLNILTKSASMLKLTQRAIELYNKQYENLEVKISENYHDRFLIIDDKHFFHIGASIKDAGNRVFMYSTIEDVDLIQSVRDKFYNEWN